MWQIPQNCCPWCTRTWRWSRWWVAISSFSPKSYNLHACVLSHVWLLGTLWTVALQAPLSMRCSRQEYWSGLPCPPPRDLYIYIYICFPGGGSDKQLSCQCRRYKRCRSETFPGRGHGNPLPYSCLEHPMDRGVWWAKVHGVTKIQTWLKQFSRYAYIYGLCVFWLMPF